MLYANKDAPRRPDYSYADAPGGGVIGWPSRNRPSINTKHIDGPLLYMRDGRLHWLTAWERIQLFVGATDALCLEYKYAPELSTSL